MKKNIILFFIITVMSFCLMSCGNKEEKAVQDTTEETTKEETSTEPDILTQYQESLRAAIDNGDIEAFKSCVHTVNSSGEEVTYGDSQVQLFFEYLSENQEKKDEFIGSFSEVTESDSLYVGIIRALYFNITANADNTTIEVPGCESQIINVSDNAVFGPLLPMIYEVTAANDKYTEMKIMKTTEITLKDEAIAIDFAGTVIEEVTEEETEEASVSVPTSVTGSGSGQIVAIDAGHQRYGNSEQEAIGPGASETKAKVTGGATGCVSGLTEYQLNLNVALKLRQELINRGYTVVMIRETNDVDMSNKERADIANSSGADIFIRIHADSSTDSSVTGASALCPSASNPYVSYLYSDSYALSQSVVNNLCNATGARNRGVFARDDMSGINWCTIPVTIIEMGFMSNATEDAAMATDAYQDKLASGIAAGVEEYFSNR